MYSKHWNMDITLVKDITDRSQNQEKYTICRGLFEKLKPSGQSTLEDYMYSTSMVTWGHIWTPMTSNFCITYKSKTIHSGHQSLLWI